MFVFVGLDQDLESGFANFSGGFNAGIGIFGSLVTGVSGFLYITEVINYFSELIRSKSSPFNALLFFYLALGSHAFGALIGGEKAVGRLIGPDNTTSSVRSTTFYPFRAKVDICAFPREAVLA